ncbi:MAG: N-acetyltransferase [Oscillospiraceae bacterium]
MNIYETCPMIENEDFLLRLVTIDDAENLLTVYSDEVAVPIFNSDNCRGDNFHYTTLARMREIIDFWIYSYNEKIFVRFSIIDKRSQTAVGTIELFNRVSQDAFNGCGIFRLDLRSDFEKSEIILSILNMIIPPAFELVHCMLIATKAIPTAAERISALNAFGFKRSAENLVGQDGTIYGDYFEIRCE